MFKKVIVFEDFDGNKCSEEHYFNYTKSELTKMNLSVDGGMAAFAEKIANEKNGKNLCDLFEKIILGAYGIKTDNKSFMKDEVETKKFASSLAYDALFNELSTDAIKFAEFFNNIIPSENKIAPDELNKIVAKATESMN